MKQIYNLSKLIWSIEKSFKQIKCLWIISKDTKSLKISQIILEDTKSLKQIEYPRVIPKEKKIKIKILNYPRKHKIHWNK